MLFGVLVPIRAVLALINRPIFCPDTMFSDLFRKKNGNWKDDTLSGLTVALALVPEAIAFSFLAGVNPIIGLWSAVFVGLAGFVATGERLARWGPGSPAGEP